MARSAMRQESSSWARWLGWTVFYGMVVWAVFFLSGHFNHSTAWQGVDAIVVFGLAGGIEFRIRDPRWILGPLVAIAVPPIIAVIVVLQGDTARVFYTGLIGIMFGGIGLWGSIGALVGLGWARRQERRRQPSRLVAASQSDPPPAAGKNGGPE